MKIKNLLPVLLLCFLSCNSKKETVAEEKFDKAKWAVKQNAEYPNRNNMLKDLMTAYEWHGVKGDSIFNLLGAPNRTDSLYFFYTVAQERAGVFPLHTKTLVIKLKADSTIEWLRIHD